MPSLSNHQSQQRALTSNCRSAIGVWLTSTSTAQLAQMLCATRGAEVHTSEMLRTGYCASLRSKRLLQSVRRMRSRRLAFVMSARSGSYRPSRMPILGCLLTPRQGRHFRSRICLRRLLLRLAAWRWRRSASAARQARDTSIAFGTKEKHSTSLVSISSSGMR